MDGALKWYSITAPRFVSGKPPRELSNFRNSRTEITLLRPSRLRHVTVGLSMRGFANGAIDLFQISVGSPKRA